MSALTFTCKQKGCPLRSGGSCLEGFSNLAECPHAEQSEASGADPDLAAGSPVEPHRDSGYQFHSGEALSYEGGSQLLKQYGGKVVVVVGAQWSGKTTLLSRIYEEFERGPFAGIRFTGSKTLLEFSRRCWLASCGSMRSKPDTERTKEWETDKLLHLQVTLEDGPSQALLIADVSGETYRLATGSTDAFRKLFLLQRADHVVLFLDCKRLSDLEHRGAVESKACTFLRLGRQIGFLGAFTNLTLVLSKWDAVGERKDNPELYAYIEQVVERVKSVAAGIGEINVRRIAARRDVAAPWVEDRELSELLLSWFKPSLRNQLQAVPPFSSVGNTRRMQTYCVTND